MPDYNLEGLSTRSFEQMVQALACKVIGPGIVVFGDGPDGGREATFTGRLSNFPSDTDCWDGYLVVQAKFCQRPKGKPKENEKWAVEQLKKELDAFSKRNTKRKKPQYYIFATNVILSPVQDTGGKDSVAALIKQYKKKIGLKDYRIWDYDQICRYLDGEESIRHLYEAWITPGDVLAKFVSRLDKASPNFGKVMANFLQKEILDDYFSKLEQAGYNPENQIPLEKVFVDLPAFDQRHSKPPDEKTSSSDLLPGFLVEMLEMGSVCLRIGKIYEQIERQRTIDQTAQSERGRYVLVGGPGQGKSTLAQFLCQIHRANLLKDQKRLDSDVKQFVKSILDKCISQQLPCGMARRFPVRVELARFAKALSSHAEPKVTSVLSYVVSLIKDKTDYNVIVEDLRQWLEKFPWMVVLDGLDEVPASSNRDQVLTAVRDFLVDISTCNADVLVIATTRPQGYNEEFSPQRYQHRWLAPLSISRALHYGQTLVELTYANIPQRKKEILSRLKNAVETPAAAKLMESPLQVTIMARLLAQVAQPPQERYRLFQQYYKVIYRREMERGVEKLSQLLRDHEANVDTIHRRTGLLLQIESERTHHTDATISIEDFKAIVSDRLRDEGYSGEELAALTNSIAICATDRLIFLVPSQSERVGFEIRSLQEFMAAEALMDGVDSIVVDRLRMIAPVPFWQNVFLFAAGKCFAERQYLRDSIAQVCAELNDSSGDKLAHLTITGSRVAVSLLEDGSARQQPAYAQTLARRALALLSLPPDNIHDRLADVYEPAFETIYREDLKLYLSQSNIADRIASWRLICRLLSEKETTWAKEMAESQWPKAIADRTKLLQNLDIDKNPWLLSKYSEIFFETPPILPHDLFFIAEKIPDLFPDNKLASQAVALYSSRHSEKGVDVGMKMEVPIKMKLRFVPLDTSRKLLSHFESLKEVHAYWKPLVEGARFAKEPSSASLVHALKSIGSRFEKGISLRSTHSHFAIPWPLRACLASAETAQDFSTLAERVKRGDMGDTSDWLEAEQRWKQKGIILADVGHMTDDQWPITRNIGKVGFPLVCAGFSGEMKPYPDNRSVDAWKIFWTSLPGEKAKSVFAPMIIFYQFIEPIIDPRLERVDAYMNPARSEFLAEIVTMLRDPTFVPDELLYSIYLIIKDTGKARSVFNHLGNLLAKSDISPWRLHFVKQGEGKKRGILNDLTANLCDWIEREPNLVGILNLLAAIASTHPIDRIPKPVMQIDENTELQVLRPAIVLHLAQKGLSKDIFEEITKRMLDAGSKNEDWVLCALRAFENNQMGNPAGIVFLQKMLTELPTCFCTARKKIVAMLEDILGRRVVAIRDRNVWEKLSLPLSLLKLLDE